MRTLFLSALCLFAQAALLAQPYGDPERAIYAEPLADISDCNGSKRLVWDTLKSTL
jgi:hypothetical protein